MDNLLPIFIIVIISFIFNSFRSLIDTNQKKKVEPVNKFPKNDDEWNPTIREVLDDRKEKWFQADQEQIDKMEPSYTVLYSNETADQEWKKTNAIMYDVEPIIGPDQKDEQRKRFHHTDIVEGIIWHEILGPPRAKKPYRPLR